MIQAHVPQERIVPEGGENPYAAHPGFDAQDCHLQYLVTPARSGSTSSHGFGCEATGGHCLPGEHCEARRKRFPESCGTGADLQRIYFEDQP